MKVAILGWGSLLWDLKPEFERQHGKWRGAGPVLKIEFCRVSESRKDALTLVIDPDSGAPCRVAYSMSHRSALAEVVADLRCREGTILANIGSLVVNGSANVSKEESLQAIKAWALQKKVDAVVWTALRNNFTTKSKVKKPFSVPAAIAHLQALDPEEKASAAEYIWRAPAFIETPLRSALQVHPWFQEAVSASNTS